MTSERTADVQWHGEFHGEGRLTTSTSRVLMDRPISWAARTAHVEGQTSPEELIAAAHASCFAMSLAAVVEHAGYAAEQLDVTATVSFEPKEGRWSITSSRIAVNGSVPGMDQSTFERITREAMDACPVSRALRGNVDMSVEPLLSAVELAAAAGP